MFFLPVNPNQHIKLDYFCQKGTKSLLLAYLIKEERSGCYIYFDKENQPLYVGKSAALHSRLKQHETVKGIELKIDNWAYIGIVLSDETHLKEAELIRQFQPPYNQLLK
jgi:excinuclease UvrABC nuclease subunit